VTPSLANESAQELVIVEVQHGAYTGEDDIVRIEDDFGRTVKAISDAS
jgi:mannose-6-phosphate isomerase